jgi:Cu-Zn family superoxide dismutase
MMRIHRISPAFVGMIGAAGLILLGQLAMQPADGQTAHTHGPATSGAPTKAVCVIHPLGDAKVHGKVTFTEVDDGIKIEAKLTGLAPGKHGFHVHEFGDCSMMDGTCAGGHFNPDGKPHGGPDVAERHAGDFGNIEADASGNAVYERVDSIISLHGDHSIIGRSIIVHADPDDLTTQPTGNAGARIGCGVIGIADPKM